MPKAEDSKTVLQLIRAVDNSIASVAYAISESVRQEGLNSHALVLRGKYIEPLETTFDQAECLNLGPNDWKGFRFRLFFELYRYVKKHRPDVVLVHRYKEFALMALIARLLGGVKVVAVFHGERGYASWFRRIICFLLLNDQCSFVAVSGSVKRYLLDHVPGLSPNKIEVIHNGIDFKKITQSLLPREEARDFLGLNDDDVVYGSVGRLVKTKGTEILVKAFSEIAQLNEKAVLVLMGEGSARIKVEALVEELNLGSRVRVMGNVKDAPKYLKGIDFFVFPSVKEGFGLALVEAFAAKVPVIFSDLDVFKVIAIDHTYMAKAGDVTDLVHKMEEAACDDSEKRQLMVSKQYSYVTAHFPIDKTIEAYKNYISRCVS